VILKAAWLCAALLVASGSALAAQASGPRFVNPPGLARPTGFRNVDALREVRGRYLDPEHPPANSLIPVTALVQPELLLEIEAVVDLSP
jgi:hypothetical protein